MRGVAHTLKRQFQLKTKYRDVAQLGSAQRSGRWGRRFKSCHPDFFRKLFSSLLYCLFLLQKLIIHHFLSIIYSLYILYICKGLIKMMNVFNNFITNRAYSGQFSFMSGMAPMGPFGMGGSIFSSFNSSNFMPFNANPFNNFNIGSLFAGCSYMPSISPYSAFSFAGNPFAAFAPQPIMPFNNFNIGNLFPTFIFPKMNFNLNLPITSTSTNPFTPPSTSTSTTSSETGNEVPDGTSVTVEGVDYSIMGSYAAKVKQLRPEMQRKVAQLFAYAKQKGWDMTITSGFRTQAQQSNLIAQGRPAAKGNTSRHLYGCAIDIRINGKAQGTSEITEMGKYAESIGLRWGRHFTHPRSEDWHFDLDPATTPKARVASTSSQSSSSSQTSQSTQNAQGSQNGSYSDTPRSDYQRVIDGTYNGSYVKMNGIIHFRYNDAGYSNVKAMKPAAQKAFKEMQKAMKKEIGLDLDFTSAYRGRNSQRASLNRYGQITVDKIAKRVELVAPIGYSEHHSGYAMDITINGMASRDNNTWLRNNILKKAYNWLIANAKRFGFEQSFPKGNAQHVSEEAWHWRFVGDSESKKVFYNARKFAGYRDLT